MNIEPPETLSEDEAKGLEYLIGFIKYDEYMSILIERFQYGRAFKNIAKNRGYNHSKAYAVMRKDLTRLVESYYIGLIFGYEKYVMNTSFEDIHLSRKAIRTIMRNDINTINDIRKAGRSKIKALRSMGEETYNEIIFKTWFLWDSECQVKLSPQHRNNITAALTEKGWKGKEIKGFLEFVEDNY
ncbi:DNA-directed RNA polymerase subunit alpha C-terminal domain-containing protein [Butyrivibrio sp. AC2005]|uniref:DNA-directed RNA polymerase subunit alpha C-terminal domain-containing protein n=1 Tax=Butyrivibrio sp. AC2005 TaxID=1280672 RepID=UPI000427245B|nr:DNA-directed RNA polymerase subunit alpha C-terminal domain-containing protein [Butyrivibrio sp. AC2005]